MAGRQSFAKNQSFLNLSDEQPKPTKKTLLERLKYVKNELEKIEDLTLKNRLKELHELVTDVLENQESEIQNLRDKIQALENDVKEEKAKNEKLQKALVVAQATWVWEKHLARFVVDSSRPIYSSGWKDQMEDYLDETNKEHNRLGRIQTKLTKWTKQHWRVINNVRRERNVMVHPVLINLNLVESELQKMSPKDQKLLREMLDELKMTASLMKFGRLTNDMFPTEKVRGMRVDARALSEIISWDCEFEDIDGLQHINHYEAKEHLKKYVDDPKSIDDYISIVDFIKNANSSRLRKLALEMEKKLSPGYGEVLSHLKKLVPNPEHKSKSPKGLDETIAKLHVPDFLPEHLWKDGIEMVDKYFGMLKMKASLMKFGRLANFCNTNKHLFPTRVLSGERIEAFALEDIISWDDNFDQISCLQSIEHTEAKEYLAKRVNDPSRIEHYFYIVDFIKDGNCKHLGKLAWEMEASGMLGDLSVMQGKALKQLRELLPNPGDESNVLDETIAKLHVPDFLPKHLWKHGMEIVEKYFSYPVKVNC